MWLEEISILLIYYIPYIIVTLLVDDAMTLLLASLLHVYVVKCV